MYINSFGLLKEVSVKKGHHSTNQIFGPPPLISLDLWPVEKGEYLHHLISLDIANMNLPFDKAIKAVSIFHAPFSPEDPEKNLLHIIKMEESQISKERISYPPNYKSWWEGNPRRDEFSSGLNFKVELQKAIPKEILIEGIANQEMFFAIPEGYEEIEDYESYIGGFPIWIQGNETPLNAEGRTTNFFMKLSGFDQWFEMSLIDEYDLYIFLTDDGEIRCIGQS